MDFFKMIYPFMPQKGDNTKLVISLVYLAALFFAGTPLITITLALTIILAPFIAVLVPALNMYLFVGLALTILSYAGVVNFFPERNEDQKNKI